MSGGSIDPIALAPLPTTANPRPPFEEPFGLAASLEGTLREEAMPALIVQQVEAGNRPNALPTVVWVRRRHHGNASSGIVEGFGRNGIAAGGLSSALQVVPPECLFLLFFLQQPNRRDRTDCVTPQSALPLH